VIAQKFGPRELVVKFDAWQIGAALLLTEGGPLKYTTLGPRIRGTGLSTLGDKGGTPAQTINAHFPGVKCDGRRVFTWERGGWYDLADREWTATIPSVRQAVVALEERRARMDELDECREQLATANAEIDSLTAEASRERLAITAKNFSLAFLAPVAAGAAE
jgi:hypothetical protein